MCPYIVWAMLASVNWLRHARISVASKQNGSNQASKKNSPGRNPKRQNKRNQAGSMTGPGVRELPMQGPAVAYSSVNGSMKPRMQSSVDARGDLRVRVKHREYIQDITGAGAATYGVSQLAINPGLPTMFPWLSALANLFESYQFRKLDFQYRTEVATSSSGKAILSVDWDAADPAPASKQAQLQERSKADGAVWQSFDLVCDKMDLDKFGVQRYVRQGALAANLDVKTYDVGVLNIGTYGASSSAASGELYVEYDVDLITPQTAPAPLSGKLVGGGTVSNAAILGTAPVASGALSLTVDPTGEIITFNSPGQYLVGLAATGTLSALVLTGGAGATVTLADFASSGSKMTLEWLVNVPVAGGTATFNTPTGTVTASVLRVAQYQYSLS